MRSKRWGSAIAGITRHKVKGVEGSIAELAEHFGLSEDTVRTRLSRGCSIKEALTQGRLPRRK